MHRASKYGYIAIGLLVFLLVISSLVRVYSPVIERHLEATMESPEKTLPPYPYPGNHIVVFLNDKRIELRTGTTTNATFPIVTIGKPGSYYETLGGVYANDYKIKTEWSTLGHVYLPWSVHVFGNFFIHGIPYYPNGERVSSAYSGGCIRLADVDAKKIYDFASPGTPIIVVKQDIGEFAPIATSTNLFASMEATRYMATLVSLEVLKQDENIQDAGGMETTRRKLIPRLLNEKDDTVIGEIARAAGNDTFLGYMNRKALSLGLTNTVFTKIDGTATTSDEDYARLIHYVSDYKSYLVGIASTTPLLFQ